MNLSEHDCTLFHSALPKCRAEKTDNCCCRVGRSSPPPSPPPAAKVGGAVSDTADTALAQETPSETIPVKPKSKQTKAKLAKVETTKVETKSKTKIKAKPTEKIKSTRKMTKANISTTGKLEHDLPVKPEKVERTELKPDSNAKRIEPNADENDNPSRLEGRIPAPWDIIEDEEGFAENENDTEDSERKLSKGRYLNINGDALY